MLPLGTGLRCCCGSGIRSGLCGWKGTAGGSGTATAIEQDNAHVHWDDEPVCSYRSGPPTWILALLAGVLFGVGMGIFTKLDGSSWWSAGVGAVVTGVPFGLVMGRWAAKWQRDVRQAQGDLPADEVALAHRAAAGGPVPDDPQVRSAALRLATHQVAQYAGRTRKLQIAVMALLFGASASELSTTPCGQGFLRCSSASCSSRSGTYRDRFDAVSRRSRKRLPRTARGREAVRWNGQQSEAVATRR